MKEDHKKRPDVLARAFNGVGARHVRESLHLRAYPVDNAQFALCIRYIVKRDLHICKRDVHQRAICARVYICVPIRLIMPSLPCAYVIMSKETYMYGKETYIYAKETHKRDLYAQQTCATDS